MRSPAMAAPCFCPAATKEGYLPPWEVVKAFAFHTVLQDVAEVQGVEAHDLVGKRVDEYISEKEKQGDRHAKDMIHEGQQQGEEKSR